MPDTKEAFKFEVTGTLAVGTGKDEWEAPFDGNLVGAVAVVKTAPTGASLILDIKKNGTTIYTNTAKRPTIAIGATSTGAPTTTVSNDASTDPWTDQNPGSGYTQPSPSQGLRTYSNTPDVVSFAAGDVFSLDVAQVGSTVAGADLDVTVEYILK